MAREKPVVSITLTEELIKRIEDFQFASRINSRSQAIAKLIELGLSEFEELDETEEQEFNAIEKMDDLMKELMDIKESMIKHRERKD